MSDEFLHLSSNFTIKRMMNRNETTLTDDSQRKHVVKDLNATDFLAFLMTDFAL